MVEVVAQ